MSRAVEALRNVRLYAITDFKTAGRGVLGKIERALTGGVDAIQLRSKCLTDREMFEMGKQIYKLTRRLKKIFIVNDRIDLMAAVNADGVHLGQDDLPLKEARRLAGDPSKIIGCSTHSLQHARQAESDGADYIGYGPIFGTPTKPDYRPVGLKHIREVVSGAGIPVVCIGGIGRDNISEVIRAGADRVAVVRAIFAAPDVSRAAGFLKKEILNAQRKP